VAKAPARTERAVIVAMQLVMDASDTGQGGQRAMAALALARIGSGVA
jgi:hypothetical protein